ncbi:MAG TPA: hypothetical protein VF516_43740 [Kofleriaceae bacterium]
MKKKIRQRTSPESTRQRRLELSRETVRTLGENDLARAVGGSVCDTTSWTTDRTITSHG